MGTSDGWSPVVRAFDGAIDPKRTLARIGLVRGDETVRVREAGHNLAEAGRTFASR